MIRFFNENLRATYIDDSDGVWKPQIRTDDVCFLSQIELWFDTLCLEAGRPTDLIAKSRSIFQDDHRLADEFPRLLFIN
jgi:hypothetical protein